MLITFSGLDGAGKSTLIEWLRTALEQQRQPVVVLHLEHDLGVYASARWLRDGVEHLVRGKGGRSNGTAARGAASIAGPQAGMATLARRIRNAVVWNKIIRRLIYPVDVLVFLCYRAYIEGMQRRILIMDRYFYDILVDVSSGQRWGWIRLLKLITPTPTLPVLLETGPEEAYARKGEYSVEYLQNRWAAYREVFPWVRAGVRLRNDDPGAARAALGQAVLHRLGAMGKRP
jgi:thymidylate kinase